MTPDPKKKVLGKGLSALITNTYSDVAKPDSRPEQAPIREVTALPSNMVKMIPIRRIVPNPDQPRQIIHESALAELAESIREQGILQPIVVTQKGESFELICGERRLRAAAIAGLEDIPALVKNGVDGRMLELALVENIQREDLNPIEEALAYAKLMEERNSTQDEVAKRVGKDRSSVANIVRLLRLPKEVQDLVANHLISAGHARALVSLLTPEHQRVLAQRILKENLSVRQTEEIAQGILSGKKRARRLRAANPHIQDLERKLETRFGTQVRVFHSKKNQGRIEIRYFSLDDLDRVLESMNIEKS